MGRTPFAPFTKIVIAVDPPSGAGTCGIVACAKDGAGNAHVLADHSVTGRTPEGWASAVAAAAHAYSSPAFAGEGDHPKGGGGASSLPIAIVAESNQGGHMVQAVLRTADSSLRVKLVHARHGKADRASPVAMLFEVGKVTLHGRFPDLEAQLCGLIAGGGYEGPGASPDRADAMVWALTELLLSKDKPEPRVRGFN
jgi:phage terminase large subunit-like protein